MVEIISIEQISPLIEEKISQIKEIKMMEFFFITSIKNNSKQENHFNFYLKF